jgi:hypothetical protein
MLEAQRRVCYLEKKIKALKKKLKFNLIFLHCMKVHGE